VARELGLASAGRLPAVLLLFPTGGLRSRRLRSILLIALALPPLLIAGLAVYPHRLLDDPVVENPFGIGAVAGAFDAAAPVALLLLALALVVAIAAMVVRVRRADGEERAQLKWALLGGAALAMQMPFEAFASARVTGLVSAVLIRSPQLTDREREVLELIAQGRNNHEIARHFVLSTKTVRNHVSNVFTKLQVADRAQAIIRAREAGLGRQPMRES
jgi:DNA-binding CsgD family transcriptional regulator